MSDMNTIKYNEGGSLLKENKEMLMNQAIELKHHADELMKVLEKSEYIEPWVVAKAERATTDLSDITHYLEGNSRKMKYGGYMQEGGEVSEFSLEQFLNFIYPNVKEIMDSNNISIDKEFIVSKDMEIAYIPHFMYEYEDDKVSELSIYYFDAQDKHIGHIEIDLEEKEIEVEFPSWSLDDEAKYSKGGMLDVGRYYKTKEGKQVRYLGNTKDPEYGIFTNKMDGVSEIRYDEIEGQDSIFAHGGTIYVDLFEYRDEMPYKVKVIVDRYEDEYGEDITYEALLQMQEDMENVGYTFDYGLDAIPYGLRPIGVEITQLRDYDDDYADGGMMASGGATFNDKVKSISKRLDKTKVPLKYRKEYGKYFSKKEATQSAQRIVGAITKKEK